jgi:hypothetical protein
MYGYGFLMRVNRDGKALYSGNATGQVILWSSEEELEAERAQRGKEIATSLSRYAKGVTSPKRRVLI